MDNERLPRKLVAVLYADVAGYSRATASDEDGSHRLLCEYLDLIAQLIGRGHGQVMHYAGDAVLAMFSAAVDALTCATQIQSEITSRNAALPAARQIQFRIGLNLGDVIQDRGDIYGTGVNVAARLEALAEPGGICVSDSIRTAVGQKLDVRYEDLGPQMLKNIETPVRAFQARAGGVASGECDVASETRGGIQASRRWPVAAGLAVLIGIIAAAVYFNGREFEPPAAGTGRPAPSKASAVAEASTIVDVPSIAVLPFVDMSPGKDQEYFADGLSEELINQFVQLQGLRVIGRTSSFAFKGKNGDLRVIGETLGVNHLLEGSVRKDRERLKITAQLNQAADGSHLWSKTYDRNLDDIFAIQEDIAKEVATALQITFGIGDIGALPGMTRNVEAYDEYLLAMSDYRQFSPTSFPRSVEHLQRAIELDPSFIGARTLLIYVYNNGSVVLPDRAAEWRRQAQVIYEETRPLAPDNPTVLLLGAGSGIGSEDYWVEVDRVIKQVQDRYGPGWDFQYGQNLLFVGRARDAVRVLEKTRSTDPLYGLVSINLAEGYAYSGDIRAAQVETERGRKLKDTPLLLVARTALFTAFATNDLQAIKAGAQTLFEIDGGNAFNVELAAIAGDKAALQAVLQRDWIGPADKTSVSGIAIAHWFAYAGNPDDALKIFKSTTGESIDIESDGGEVLRSIWRPVMREMRKLPGFKDLVRDLGLVAYWRATGNWGDFCHPVGADDFECQ